MSRTHKGSKGPGYDYWSRRMGNGGMCNCPSYGRESAKTTTHRKERRRDKRMAQQSGVIYR